MMLTYHHLAENDVKTYILMSCMGVILHPPPSPNVRQHFLAPVSHMEILVAYAKNDQVSRYTAGFLNCFEQ